MYTQQWQHNRKTMLRHTLTHTDSSHQQSHADGQTHPLFIFNQYMLFFIISISFDGDHKYHYLWVRDARDEVNEEKKNALSMLLHRFGSFRCFFFLFVSFYFQMLLSISSSIFVQYFTVILSFLSFISVRCVLKNRFTMNTTSNATIQPSRSKIPFVYVLFYFFTTLYLLRAITA